jgi:hypothetical protein
VGLTLGPQAVADQPHALPVLEDVWRGLVVEGRVLPVEAWRTPRAIAARLVHGGGADVRLGTGHQPPLPHAMPLVFPEAHMLAEPLTAPATGDSGHGRREPRRLPTRSALVGYRDGPGLAQVCPLERGVIMQKSGEQRHEVVDGVTSRGPDQADPKRLLGVVRQP